MENEPRPPANETEPTGPDFTSERLREVFPDVELDVLDQVATLAETEDIETAAGFLLTVLIEAGVDEAEALEKMATL